MKPKDGSSCRALWFPTAMTKFQINKEHLKSKIPKFLLKSHHLTPKMQIEIMRYKLSLKSRKLMKLTDSQVEHIEPAIISKPRRKKTEDSRVITHFHPMRRQSSWASWSLDSNTPTISRCRTTWKFSSKSSNYLTAVVSNGRERLDYSLSKPWQTSKLKMRFSSVVYQ